MIRPHETFLGTCERAVISLSQKSSCEYELNDSTSAVPLVSRILPSDVCRIMKRGGCIRMDTTLVDFQDMKWQRGDLSLLFRADVNPSERLLVMDNVKKTYQKISTSVSIPIETQLSSDRTSVIF